VPSIYSGLSDPTIPLETVLTYEEKALNQFDSLRTTRLFARNVVDIAAGRAIRPVVVCGHAFSVAAILT